MTAKPPSSASRAPGGGTWPSVTADRAGSFNAAAVQYAAGRPSYPPAVLDAVEELWGRSSAGALAVDVGAGTGIATRLLRERGARVVAVEPGAGMAVQFRRILPAVPLVRGDGNALPLAGSCADLVTYAQSWHWTDPARAVPEAWRVLRPGGALALWWNEDALDVPWIAAQADRVVRHFGTDPAPRPRDHPGRLRLAFAGVSPVPAHAHRTLRWARTVPVDTHLANIGSRSCFLVQGSERARDFLAEERARLLADRPDGLVEEVYDVLLIVVRKRGPRGRESDRRPQRP
ncbi:class I SAM-dependent methyltransferase [Streptomyces gamaensis]|uniref:Class I SAM-dependent methyltransferase n=1 Tax=Streptomyces gamaensis TaxID=1763542 RepID=A0ABW0Z0E5_9ACTN